MKFCGIFAVFIIYLAMKDGCVTGMKISTANKYIDKVLGYMRNATYLQKVDPILLHDFQEGKFKGYNFILKGLSTIHRDGDVDLIHKDEESILEVQFEVTDLSLSLDYDYKVLFFSVSGAIDASADKLLMTAEISLRNVKHSKPKLDDVRVTSISGFRINSVTGLSFLFNWALKLLVRSRSSEMIMDQLKFGVSDSMFRLLPPALITDL